MFWLHLWLVRGRRAAHALSLRGFSLMPLFLRGLLLGRLFGMRLGNVGVRGRRLAVAARGLRVCPCGCAVASVGDGGLVGLRRRSPMRTNHARRVERPRVRGRGYGRTAAVVSGE